MASINQEMLEKSGFNYAIKIWDIYSLSWPSRLDTTKKPSWLDYLQRLRAIICVVFSVGWIAYSILRVAIQLSQFIFDQNLSVIEFFVLLTELSIIVNISAFIHTYFYLPKYHRFTVNLASAVQQFAPTKMGVIRQWVRLTFAANTLVVLVSLLCCMYFIVDNYDEQWEVQALWLFHLVIASYSIFYEMWYLTFCKVISLLWSTLESDQSQICVLKNRKWTKRNRDPSMFLILHHAICNLIADMDAIFSPYMAVALAGELTFLVLASQILASPGGKDRFLILILNAAFHAISYTLKTLFAAAVNEKVTSTLDLAAENPTGHMETFSATNDHYLLYLNELATIKPQLTYGGIIAITKEFIFTVTGTIVTYGIALQDLKEKGEDQRHSENSAGMNDTCLVLANC